MSTSSKINIEDLFSYSTMGTGIKGPQIEIEDEGEVHSTLAIYLEFYGCTPIFNSEGPCIDIGFALSRNRIKGLIECLTSLLNNLEKDDLKHVATLEYKNRKR